MTHTATKEPCKTCPYRKDVPSGIWHPAEYVKLPKFDGDIKDQIVNGGAGLFMCHQGNNCLCTGWLACHGPENLVAMRMARDVDPKVYNLGTKTPVFSSGLEAAQHGMAGVHKPDDKARKAIDKLEKTRERRNSNSRAVRISRP